MQRRLITAALLFGVFLAIALSVTMLGAPSFDRQLDSHAASLRDGAFGQLLNGLSVIGYPGWFAAIVVIIVIVLVVLHRTFAAAELIAAVLLANASFALSKQLFQRARPSFPEHVIGGYSLPSGHATMSFTLATVLLLAVPELRRPWLAIPIAAYALLTVLSRVVLGVHYTTDVVAGACLGMACALVVDAIATRLAERRAAVG